MGSSLLQEEQFGGWRCETREVWVRRVCPIRRRLRAISALRECWLAVDLGRGVGLISASLLFVGGFFSRWSRGG